METMGYIASLLIGVSLGLIGGGGSILTMPVLVYLFRVPPLLATSYSLVVVGVVSLFGFIGHAKAKLVAFRIGLVFGLSSIATVFLTRYLIVPKLSSLFFTVGSATIDFSSLTMILFGLLMIAAAAAMNIRKNKQNEFAQPVKRNPLWLIVYGCMVGLVTGILGAGGGFLLIPALILFARLPMKTAIGTSLMIITLNSLVGALADLQHLHLTDGLLIRVTALAVAGLAGGIYLGRFINPTRLKTGFGWFVLMMGLYILTTELIK